MDQIKAYFFLVGLYIGGYSNFFSKLVISGLVLYIVHPRNFNIDRFEPLYHRITERTYPYISRFYRIKEDEKEETEEKTEEKVSIVPSPEPSYTNKLPPLLQTIKLNILK